MGKQHNKMEKRKRRKQYVKRKKAASKGKKMDGATEVPASADVE